MVLGSSTVMYLKCLVLSHAFNVRFEVPGTSPARSALCQRPVNNIVGSGIKV